MIMPMEDELIDETGSTSRDEAEAQDDDYLFGFSNEELIDVISSRDKWNWRDVEAAEVILRDRGIVFDEAEKRRLLAKRVQEVRATIEGRTAWIIFGFVLAFLGGLLGIAIGWDYYFHKAKDPLNQIYYIYGTRTRRLGLVMMMLGLLSVLVTAVSYLGQLASSSR